ncbi:MAG: SCP2 sterol-binding domain-containing protein [Myxococcaceae bacterium]|nr:SCP2 sterol-binding domain-containing protein [Myxococcaceae bacterium]
MSFEFSAPPRSSGGGAEPSPAHKRALGLAELFQRALQQAPARVGRVKGNLLIFVPGVATWTIVTQGPGRGVYDSATDEDVHFAMSCADDLLVQLFVGATDLDLPAALASGHLKLEGDVMVFGRFVELITSAT